jgi:carboxyl-terminal processing protease
MDLKNRFEHGEYVYADSIRFPDSLKYTTGRGRIVYGGGGIMPDVFIAWDSTWFSDYYVDIRRKGVMNSFTLEYVDEQRAELSKVYPSLDAFIGSFQVEGDVMDRFLKEVGDEGIEFDEEGWKASSKLVSYQIKAMIARNLWDINAYYEVMMAIDDEYLKAIELFSDEKAFQKLHIG